MSASLSPYAKHVWGSFVGFAREWRAQPRSRSADALTRWARIAYSTPTPGAGDRDWERQVLRAIEAGREFSRSDYARREALFEVIAPVLDRLGSYAGAIDPAQAVAPARSPGAAPYYLRD